ncbi:FG-GAP-like repeat-containing protein [Chloroflexota bacterium]
MIIRFLGIAVACLIFGIISDWSFSTMVPAQVQAAGSDLLIETSVTFTTGNYTYENVIVTNNATLTLDGIVTIKANSFTIDTGATVTANGLGYTWGQGPGAGETYFSYGGGAGHGGNGGMCDCYYHVAGGTAYGSMTEPTEPGSGGGGGTYAGAGGGVIRLDVTGMLTINGSVTADGDNARWLASDGGGSGGSIYITTHTLAGSGSITVDGGNAVEYKAGGGAGGRIAIYYITDNFIGVKSAHGGSGIEYGGAGTIFTRGTDIYGDLIIHNNTTPGTTSIPDGTHNFNSIAITQGNLIISSGSTVTTRNFTIGDNATLYQNGGSITTGNLSILSGGTVTHSTGYTVNLTVTTDLIVAEGGNITANGLGYRWGQGPGAGETYFSYGGGAGHGGNGGMCDCYYHVAGGTAYGSMTEPTEPGSGGGGGTYAGAGGGVIRLDVTGMLTINGSVTADGDNARWTASDGGGSGGSIYITTHTLAGSGSITVDGGNAVEYKAGGGAGGRIAIYYITDNFIGIKSAHGGSGIEYGGAGTIFLDNMPQVMISTNQTPVEALVESPPTKPYSAQLRTFYSTNSSFNPALPDPYFSVNLSLPTIVLTHGWNPDYPTFATPSGTVPDMVNELGQVILERFGDQVNIFWWNWTEEARAGSPVDPANNTWREGGLLADSLYMAFGDNYTHEFHFIGHSLGTMVNKVAVDVLLQKYDSQKIHVTILDAAEIGDLARRVQPIPEQAVWIDSYITAFGDAHNEAVNVILRENMPISSNPTLVGTMRGLISSHSYAWEWYRDTIIPTEDFPQPTTEKHLMGNQWSFENGGFTGWPGSNSYFIQTRSTSDSKLYLEGSTPTQATIILLGRSTLLIGQAGLITLTAITNPIKFIGDVVSDYYDIEVDGLVQRAFKATLREASPTYIWVPVQIPDEATHISFEYIFPNRGDGDFLSVGINTTQLFAIEGELSSNTTFVSSSYIDISNWQGQNVELFIGLESSGAPNAEVIVQNIAFHTIDDSLMIFSKTPGSNSLNTTKDSIIQVQFTSSINATSINESTFNVDGSISGKISGNYTGGGTANITFNPFWDFQIGETITVTLTTGINGTDNRTLSEPVTWQFTVEAPQGYGGFTDSGQLLGSSSSRAVSLGDIDGDGDLDAFIANLDSIVDEITDHSNKVWLNDGSGNFTNSGQFLGDSPSTGVSMGDVDSDGDLDAFVTNHWQANKIWLNNGSGNFTDSGQSLSNSPDEDVSLGDIDGDGDLDAFIANDQQANTVWLNNGSGNFTDSGQSLGNSDSMKVSLGDVDSDGDLDAFVANFGSQANKVWLNDGSGNFTDSGQSLGSYGSFGISLGDVDGDGDLDAFVSNFEVLVGNKVWLNNGTGNFTDSGQSLSNTGGIYNSLGDVDGDGDLDAFTIVSDSPNEVWLNNGSGNFSDNGLSLGNSSSLGIALGDIDGDGDLDAFVANDNDQGNKVWLNVPPPTIITTSPGNNMVSISIDTTIQIIYNVHMNTSSVESAFSILPPITGNFTWSDNNTIMTFTPTQSLSNSTTYTATTAQSLAGSSLWEDYHWSFTTELASGCFIATAAYGTDTAEEIQILRDYRDGVLLNNKLGAEFVRLYYQYSPPIADFISQCEVLRTIVREGIIDPIVAIVERGHSFWSD